MALRLADEGSDRGGDDREGLSEARRAVGATRARLEELADRLRELGRRLGGDPDERRAPEVGSTGRGSAASSSSFESGRSPHGLPDGQRRTGSRGPS